MGIEVGNGCFFSSKFPFLLHLKVESLMQQTPCIYLALHLKCRGRVKENKIHNEYVVVTLTQLRSNSLGLNNSSPKSVTVKISGLIRRLKPRIDTYHSVI